jgi:hypothetical protein
MPDQSHKTIWEMRDASAGVNTADDHLLAIKNPDWESNNFRLQPGTTIADSSAWAE